MALMFSAIVYGVTQYSVEELKQDAFMMKACADAGGEWVRTWNNRTQCLRPQPKKP